MALFKKKAETEEEVPPLLEREGRALRHAGMEAYRWLGSRYLWYRKIRTAKPNALPFMGKNLEEKMQATRSALRRATSISTSPTSGSGRPPSTSHSRSSVV